MKIGSATAVGVICVLATAAKGQFSTPETVVVHHGSVTLHALLWRPQGRCPFPDPAQSRQRPDPRRTGATRSVRGAGLHTRARIRSPWLYIFVFFQQGVGLSAD
jgi:hypothetical protein